MKLYDESDCRHARSGPFAGDPGEAERLDVAGDIGAPISRRMAVGGVAFFGGATSALRSRAFGQSGASGSYSNAAIAAEPPEASAANSDEDLVRAVKIARAMRSGPLQITRDATVAEMDRHGNIACI